MCELEALTLTWVFFTEQNTLPFSPCIFSIVNLEIVQIETIWFRFY